MLDQGYYDREKKKQSLGWRIFFIVLISLIVIVYLVIFLRFFQTCESGDSKIVYLSQQASQLYNADKASLKVHKLTPRNPITSDGSFYMSFIAYLESTDELQITVKYRDTILADKENTNPYTYKLYDEDGTQFPMYYTTQSERNGYYYTKLCFSELKFDFEEHTPIYLEILNPDGSTAAKLTLFDAYTSASEMKDYQVSEINQQLTD
ncbi:MAG: hypothetical protein AB9835_02820 [Eubacteriales bacterium]